MVAVGLRPSSLGVPGGFCDTTSAATQAALETQSCRTGVDEHCFFLKNIDDARRLRKRVTLNFEAADLPGKSHEDQHSHSTAPPLTGSLLRVHTSQIKLHLG